jgi:hypothetical protein
MKITASIIDYLGKYEIGVLVSVGLMYEGQFYGGSLFYTDTQMNINVEDSLTEKLGHQIEEHEEYLAILKYLIENVSPYEKIINQLEEINLNEY